jgi:hypothetical protein
MGGEFQLGLRSKGLYFGSTALQKDEIALLLLLPIAH